MTAGRALGLVASAAVLANSSWFSATAVVPAPERQWRLTPTAAAWLVIVVQIGFVVGSVGAALLNLPDRVQPRLLIAGSSIGAGTENAGLLLAGGLTAALPLRFLVGVTLPACRRRHRAITSMHWCGVSGLVIWSAVACSMA
jgi:hypothetical protein